MRLGEIRGKPPGQLPRLHLSESLHRVLQQRQSFGHLALFEIGVPQEGAQERLRERVANHGETALARFDREVTVALRGVSPAFRLGRARLKPRVPDRPAYGIDLCRRRESLVELPEKEMVQTVHP